MLFEGILSEKQKKKGRKESGSNVEEMQKCVGYMFFFFKKKGEKG